jgi:translocation and assembly module TamB
MNRRVRWAGIAALAVLSGLGAVVLLLWLFANTGPGRTVIAWSVSPLTGGDVAVHGLSGQLPGELEIDDLELSDPHGVWLKLSHVSLKWSPFALFSRHVAASRLAVGEAYVVRYPHYPPSPEEESKWRFDVADVRIARLELAPALAERRTALALVGRGHYVSLKDCDVDAEARELDGIATYRLKARSDRAQVTGAVAVHEEPNGPLSRVLGLPALGAVSVEARVDGPRGAENALVLVTAGALVARASGTVDLDRRLLSAAVTMTAPAMAPRKDVSWQSASLTGRITGAFAKPEASGRLTIDGVRASGASLGNLTAELYGHAGRAALNATLTGLRLAGPAPNLLAGAPVKLEIETRLDKPTWPIAFLAAHPLVSVRGQGALAEQSNITLNVAVPDLSPFGPLASRAIRGRARIAAQIASNPKLTQINVRGTVFDAGGDAPAALLGRKSDFAAGVDVTPNAITLKSAHVAGKALRGDAFGGFDGKAAQLTVSLAIADLSRLPGNFTGSLSGTGHLEGPIDAVTIVAQADGSVASRGFSKSPVHAAVSVSGWPRAAKGNILLSGSLDGAPLAVSARLERGNDRAARLLVDRLAWKSVDASGNLLFVKTPSGKLEFLIGRLGDLAPFLGEAASGRVSGTLALASLNGRLVANIKAAGDGLASSGVAVGGAKIAGAIVDPFGKPSIDAHVSATRLAVQGLGGNTELAVKGPLSALGYRLTADAHDAGGAPLRMNAVGSVDATRSRITIQTFQADLKGEAIRLLAPTAIDLAKGARIDRVRIGAGKAVLEAEGAITPRLDFSLSARNLTPDLAKPFVPELEADGVFSADAKLRGTLAAPEGTLSVQGNGVRWRNTLGQSVPAAHITLTADIAKQIALVHAQLNAGQAANVSLNGETPLKRNGRFDLHGSGSLNTAAVLGVLAASGRTMKGVLTFDGRFLGTLDAPQLAGTARLKDGDMQDYVNGVHVSNIEASLHAQNNRVVIDQFSGHAGPGTLTATGTIAVSSKSIPLDVTITAINARPVETDLVSAEVDGKLRLTGTASSPALGGTIDIRRGEINLAQSLPPTIATLNVHRKGKRFRRLPPSSTPARLDLTVHCTGELFVRGRGLDAVMGGDLRVQGSSDAPFVSGGFTMRRGTFDLAGQTLQFSSGKIVFDGGSPSSSIDPRLDFVAQTSASGITATLGVGGYASAPTVKLTSSPLLPQDEILSALMFGQSSKQLGTLQLAQIAEAVASIGGGSGLGNPVAMLRTRLGLDRLAVAGSDPNTHGLGATIEVGKYVAKGVYVGGKQNTEGGTQAEVQYDITKNLKAEATISAITPTTTTPSTPLNDKGSSVGLSYEFEY